MDAIDLLDATFIEYKATVRISKPGLYIFRLSDGSNFIARARKDHGAGCEDCRFNNDNAVCKLVHMRGRFMCDVIF